MLNHPRPFIPVRARHSPLLGRLPIRRRHPGTSHNLLQKSDAKMVVYWFGSHLLSSCHLARNCLWSAFLQRFFVFRIADVQPHRTLYSHWLACSLSASSASRAPRNCECSRCHRTGIKIRFDSTLDRIPILDDQAACRLRRPQSGSSSNPFAPTTSKTPYPQHVHATFVLQIGTTLACSNVVT